MKEKNLIDTVTGRIDDEISKMGSELDIRESFRGVASQLDAENGEPYSTSRPSKERREDLLKSEEMVLESMVFCRRLLRSKQAYSCRERR